MFRIVFTFPLLVVALLFAGAAGVCGFFATFAISGWYWGNRWAHAFASYIRGVDEDVVDRRPYEEEELRRIAQEEFDNESTNERGRRNKSDDNNV